MNIDEVGGTPQEFVNWAEKDFALKNKRGVNNGWSNLKQALNTQVDIILNENNFSKEAKTWDLPSKLQKVRNLGYTTPTCFSNLIKIRNYLIHRNTIPKEDPTPYIEVVRYFIDESGRKLRGDKKKDKLNIEELLGQFKVQLQKEDKSAYTIKNYLLRIKAFLNFVERDPKEVKEHHLENFILHLKKLDKSCSIQSVTRSALLAFYNKILHKNFRINIQTRRNPREFKTLSKGQIKELFRLISDKRDRLIISLLYGSGLKVGNVVRLKKEDIDFDSTLNRITRTGTQSKYSSEKQVFIIPDVIRDELKEYSKDKADYLFLIKNKSDSLIRRIEQKLQSYSNIMGCSINPRILRNSFEKHLKEKGVDEISIQMLLGKFGILRSQGFQLSSDSDLEKIKSPLDELIEK